MSRTLARAKTPGRPIGMAALHSAGGVPPGWRFSVPPGDAAAGGRDFVALGCNSCHAVDAGGRGGPMPGPDLSGMGSHHPPEYFAESILSPDAVVVEGPGYAGPDGRSIMPVYPDLTLAELADLVAYVGSLKGREMPMLSALPAGVSPGAVPAPPPNPAGLFLVQSYDVKEEVLAEFERWFAAEGRAGFLAQDGVLAFETWVDRTRPSALLTTVVAFRDQEALDRFYADAAAEQIGLKFDDFIGPHDHRLFVVPPLYRVDGLSGSRPETSSRVGALN